MTEGQRPAPESTSDPTMVRDSQLSAMFDGELSPAECELLARRLARDEALRAQWSRFSLIGAALRAERGVKLHDRVAVRVQAALAQEPTYGEANGADNAAVSARPAAQGNAARADAYERWLRFARPVAGVGIAAGVAAVSILWLRNQEADPALVASAPPAEQSSIVLQPEVVDPEISADAGGTSIVLTAQNESAPVSNGEPERYSTPAPSTQTSIAPPARFANYVVAHSEYSGPLARRMGLLGIVGAESASEAPQAGDETPPQAQTQQAPAQQAPVQQRPVQQRKEVSNAP